MVNQPAPPDPKPFQAMHPLFIFSLPRAGSTLLQRMLATHEDIATTAEPWLLLPQLYALKSYGIAAEYDQNVAATALNDFIAQLPGGKADYMAGLRDLTLSLYRAAAKNKAAYFLDKTPRYHLISDDVIGLFPEGKFIILWRNPLAVIASMIETWGAGQWNLYRFDADLQNGVHKMLDCQTRFADRVLVLRYEDLLSTPQLMMDRIYAYLGIHSIDQAAESFARIKLEGRMGDPTGVKNYASLSQAPLDKWKATLASPARKYWCRNYLKQLGADKLSTMGYDLDALLQELDAIPTNLTKLPSDIFYMSKGWLRAQIRKKVVGFN